MGRAAGRLVSRGSTKSTCSYADQCENLSLAVGIKIKLIGCYFVIVFRPVEHVKYFQKTYCQTGGIH